MLDRDFRDVNESRSWSNIWSSGNFYVNDMTSSKTKLSFSLYGR